MKEKHSLLKACCGFSNSWSLKMQQNLWPYLLAPNSLIIRRNRNVLSFGNQGKHLYDFMKYHPVRGWVTPSTFIFTYLPSAWSVKLKLCVYKAHTSVVIYMDFKENRSEPQKKAYWYHSFSKWASNKCVLMNRTAKPALRFGMRTATICSV